jgi:hypothetical protein
MVIQFLNMELIRLPLDSPQFPDQGMILRRARRRVCSLLFPNRFIPMPYHHGHLPLKDVFRGSSDSCLLSDLKREYGFRLTDLLHLQVQVLGMDAGKALNITSRKQ